MRGIDFELDESTDRFQRVAEQKPRPLPCSEKIADHRKPATSDASVKDGRAARLVHAPLDFGRFEVRVDLALDADQLAGPLQIADTFAEVSIAHLCVTRSWGFESRPLKNDV